MWEKELLRILFGGKVVEDLWMRRTKQELKEQYNEANISVMKAKRCYKREF